MLAPPRWLFQVKFLFYRGINLKLNLLRRAKAEQRLLLFNALCACSLHEAQVVCCRWSPTDTSAHYSRTSHWRTTPWHIASTLKISPLSCSAKWISFLGNRQHFQACRWWGGTDDAQDGLISSFKSWEYKREPGIDGEQFTSPVCEISHHDVSSNDWTQGPWKLLFGHSWRHSCHTLNRAWCLLTE